MRARFAYISSLGTTAILVAAALLMLALVGAIVAFRGWPGSANGAGVQQVPLGPRPASAHAVIVRPLALATRAVRAGSIVNVATARAHLTTAGLVKQAGPKRARGLAMEPVPPATMRAVRPQPVVPAGPADQPAIAPPGAPSPGDPGSVTGPSSPLAGLLPDPNGSPSGPQSEVTALVGGLIGPPPPTASGVAAALGLR